MFRKSVASVALAAVALVPGAALFADGPPPASRWIADDAVAVLEVSQPKALLDLAYDSEVARTLMSSPSYQKLASHPKYKEFLGVVGYLEGRLRTDWRTGVKRLVGGVF